jgi:hypothetical protein
MYDLMNPSFGHHLIPLLSLPGAAGASGGKAHLAAVKDTCESVERIHGPLKMLGRFEVAIVPAVPDFFDPAPGLAKARNLAWELIRNTPYLQWVVLTRNPESFYPSLPPAWVGKGFQNFCFGLVVDGSDGIAEKLQALQKAPVQRRMIFIGNHAPAMDLRGSLGGIDWVVFSGNSGDLSQATVIEVACREAKVAFLFHQTDKAMPSGPDNDGAGDSPPWPAHPFGTKIQLSQPTLPNLKLVITSTEESFSPPAYVEKPPESSPLKLVQIVGQPVAKTSQPPTVSTELATEIMKFEIVSLEMPPLEPNPALPAISNDVHLKFAELDGVVRQGLVTFKEVGHALAEIRDRTLWRAGGHTSWAAYCHAVGGLTKSHANRLINSSNIAKRLARVTPIGVTLLTESQVRPLCRLKSEKLQITALSRAVERAGDGGQPTAKLLRDIVAELMADDSPKPTSKPNQKQLVAAALQRLRTSVVEKDPVEQIDGLIAELEKLLKLT